MPVIGKIIGALIRVLSFVGTICIVLMMLHVAADVVMRYLFNTPLPGTLTIVSRYYMVLLVFLSLAAVEKQGAQITVEVVHDRLPALVRKGLAPLSFLLTSVVFALLAVRAAEVAWDQTRLGAAVAQGTTVIPVWPSYWPVAIGSGAIALYALFRLLGGQNPSVEGELRETLND